jgi:hypothetical protein
MKAVNNDSFGRVNWFGERNDMHWCEREMGEKEWVNEADQMFDLLLALLAAGITRASA